MRVRAVMRAAVKVKLGAHREWMAAPNMKGWNPVALVRLQPHVDILLPIGWWRRAKGHLIHGVAGHVPHDATESMDEM